MPTKKYNIDDLIQVINKSSLTSEEKNKLIALVKKNGISEDTIKVIDEALANNLLKHQNEFEKQKKQIDDRYRQLMDSYEIEEKYLVEKTKKELRDKGKSYEEVEKIWKKHYKELDKLYEKYKKQFKEFCEKALINATF